MSELNQNDDDLWAEFDVLEDSSNFDTELSKLGLSPEIRNRMLRRGFVVTGIRDGRPAFDIVSGTTADRFRIYLHAEGLVESENFSDKTARFFKDAVMEEDDDRFQNLWPELF